MPELTYTYRGGERVELEKQPDQFVVRALPDDLDAAGAESVERVSSHSSLVTVPDEDLEPMMELARRQAPTHHAYRLADTGEEFLITDRIFVVFREPVAAGDLAGFTGRHGLVMLESYSPREYLFQLTDHTGVNPVKLVVKLVEEEGGLVESADHDLNYRATTYQLALPTDPSYERQWHLHRRLVDAAFDPRSSSRCEEAWQILGHHGSSEVVVGVTDDGCRLDHPDFDAPGKFAGWGYFVGTRLVRHGDADAIPGAMFTPGATHGTSCAGVIAAEIDALMTVGAAPGCRLLPIKWESEGPYLLIGDSKLMTALDYVADKVDVLSNSWGKTPTSLTIPTVRNRIAQLAQTGGRRGRGILFLWAAGNENCPIQHDAGVDVPYTNGWELGPGGNPSWVKVATSRRFRNNLVGIVGVAHVAALASNAQRSHYSNYGTGIVLTAPSSNSHEYGRLTVTGLGITTATGTGVTPRFGGTSSATPLVAGVAALVRSANPDLTAVEVLSLLKRTAAKDLRLDAYPRTPPASYDTNPSWDVSPVAPFDRGDFVDVGDPDGTWSPWFGHGRVDAAAAVAMARSSSAGRSTRFASRPGRAIPDAAAAGIRDTIAVAATGLVERLAVEIDVSHPWIGDLRITLSAPGGRSVVLHDRAGARTRDLRRTFDISTTPALAALVGGPAPGDWVLTVADVAPRDEGSLQAWALELQTAGDAIVVEDAAAARIPDSDPNGIRRRLDVAAPAGSTMADVSVSVDVTHSWIGDLRIDLHAPGAAPVRLHDRAGGDADNIVTTWSSRDLPALRALRGRDPSGRWELSVADLVRQDEGKLNRWRLEIATR
jgi:subtilisin-like proprotein convertase family protein/subtilisin family serine protease